MKKILVFSLSLIIASTGLQAQTKAGRLDTTHHSSYYTCPKHPDIVQHQPGKCPTCGMPLNLSTKEKMKAGVVNNYTCPVHLDVTKHDPGKCPKCGKKLNLSAKEQMKAEVMKIYTCPMHPEVALDKDGICPKCGKALVKKKKIKA